MIDCVIKKYLASIFFDYPLQSAADKVQADFNLDFAKSFTVKLTDLKAVRVIRDKFTNPRIHPVMLIKLVPCEILIAAALVLRFKGNWQTLRRAIGFYTFLRAISYRGLVKNIEKIDKRIC